MKPGSCLESLKRAFKDLMEPCKKPDPAFALSVLLWNSDQAGPLLHVPTLPPPTVGTLAMRDTWLDNSPFWTSRTTPKSMTQTPLFVLNSHVMLLGIEDPKPPPKGTLWRSKPFSSGVNTCAATEFMECILPGPAVILARAQLSCGLILQ